jgi:hypothetical protein
VKRVTRTEVDRACGQTPCLCGDIESWHPDCFAGKAAEQVKAEYEFAYRIARVKLQTRANQRVAQILYLDRHNRSAEGIAASAIAKASKRP